MHNAVQLTNDVWLHEQHLYSDLSDLSDQSDSDQLFMLRVNIASEAPYSSWRDDEWTHSPGSYLAHPSSPALPIPYSYLVSQTYLLETESQGVYRSTSLKEAVQVQIDKKKKSLSIVFTDASLGYAMPTYR